METTGFVKVFERVPGHGEDAAVCVEWSAGAVDEPSAACACAGVFDGLGGLGARPVDIPAGLCSEARAASHCARDALGLHVARVGEHLRERFASCTSDTGVLAAAQEARRGIEAAFDATFVQLHDRVGGALLPTNAALALRAPACGRDVLVALWAGDARCYLLDPAEGLHQLSVDDNGTGADALADLRGAAPAAQTRRLGYDVASGPGTRLSMRVVELGAPALAVCCTDGAYAAGIRSPMHLELLLWRWALADAGPAGLGPQAFALMDAHWAARAQDDCSVAGFAAGGELDAAWRDRGRRRMNDVYARYIAPFPAPPGRHARPEAHDAYGRAVDALWGQYKPGYACYQQG